MPRCGSCNSVLTRKDIECYVCGEPVEGLSTFRRWLLRAAPKPVPPEVKRVLETDWDLNRDPGGEPHTR